MRLQRFFSLHIFTNRKTRWFFLLHLALSLFLFFWVTWTLTQLLPRIGDGSEPASLLAHAVLNPYVRLGVSLLFVVMGTGLSASAISALPRIEAWIAYLHQGGDPYPLKVRADDKFEFLVALLNTLLVEGAAEGKRPPTESIE